ncbi:MAG: hypothetical protein WC196_02905 [Bacilli bacterium]
MITLSNGQKVGLGILGRSPAKKTDYTVNNIPPKAVAKGFSLDMFNLFGSEKKEIDTDEYFSQGRSQSEAGTCVFNGWTNAMAFLEKIETGESEPLSRLYGYWYGRYFMEGYTKPVADTGSYIKTGAYISHKGYPVEAVWPYDLSKLNVEPSGTAQYFATEKLDTYFNLDPIGTSADKLIEAMKKWSECLCPMVLAILLGESYPDCFTNGFIKVPNFMKESVLGWHGICLCGYSSTKKAFRIQNSHDGFGENPKMLGWLPEDYFRVKYAQKPIAMDVWVGTKGTWLKERRFK